MMRTLHVVETLYYCIPVKAAWTEEESLKHFLAMDPVTRDSFCQECRERETELKDAND